MANGNNRVPATADEDDDNNDTLPDRSGGLGRRSFLKAAASTAALPLLATGAKRATAQESGSSRRRHLRIASADGSKVTYEFTATGEIEPDDDAGKDWVEDNDAITENDDGTWTAKGYVVGQGRDAFYVNGEITEFTPLDQLDVRLDGLVVNQGELENARGAGALLGGGEGYPNGVPESEASVVVSTYDDLSSELSAASSGDVVFVQSGAEIDLGSNSLTIPSGVTLASDRGVDGAAGGHLTTDEEVWPTFTVKGAARVTGVRISGPNWDYRPNSKPVSIGLNVKGKDVEIDNCEIFGFAHAAVSARRNTHVHHCDIHHNPMDGLGYGVNVKSGHPVVEYCTFDANRHSVASDGSGGYTVRHNHFGSTAYGHVIDCHRPGGTELRIHHNTIEAVELDNKDKKASGVTIRGVPDDDARIAKNWFHNPKEPRDSPTGGWTEEAITQVHVDDWSSVDYDGNAYGAEEPSADVGCPR